MAKKKTMRAAASEAEAGKAPKKRRGDERGDLAAKKVKVNGVAVEEEAQKLQGMQKWIADYNAKRPGLAALQQQIDSFIADFEDREQEAKRAREEAAAKDDGWTLVSHKKGRKKTTDAASGAVVGAVSAAAVAQSAANSKSHTFSDFYKFQKREARRNEVLELQLKFQEDKKRIAQLRAARKFRPF